MSFSFLFFSSYDVYPSVRLWLAGLSCFCAWYIHPSSNLLSTSSLQLTLMHVFGTVGGQANKQRKGVEPRIFLLWGDSNTRLSKRRCSKFILCIEAISMCNFVLTFNHCPTQAKGLGIHFSVEIQRMWAHLTVTGSPTFPGWGPGARLEEAVNNDRLAAWNWPHELSSVCSGAGRQASRG